MTKNAPSWPDTRETLWAATSGDSSSSESNSQNHLNLMATLRKLHEQLYKDFELRDYESWVKTGKAFLETCPFNDSRYASVMVMLGVIYCEYGKELFRRPYDKKHTDSNEYNALINAMHARTYFSEVLKIPGISNEIKSVAEHNNKVARQLSLDIDQRMFMRNWQGARARYHIYV